MWVPNEGDDKQTQGFNNVVKQGVQAVGTDNSNMDIFKSYMSNQMQTLGSLDTYQGAYPGQTGQTGQTADFPTLVKQEVMDITMESQNLAPQNQNLSQPTASGITRSQEMNPYPNMQNAMLNEQFLLQKEEVEKSSAPRISKTNKQTKTVTGTRTKHKLKKYKPRPKKERVKRLQGSKVKAKKLKSDSENESADESKSIIIVNICISYC